MNYLETYIFWKNDEFFDEATRNELAAIDPEKDGKEIEDRFYRDLEFGTGGLRGVMGAGTNRMNKYTVGKATAGLGKYLLDTYGPEACRERGVAIGYDTRNNSEYFSRITANVLSGMGIRVYLHDSARPTPQLSFSVKLHNALAGVVVTASHNPKEYNGYKVYDEHGCQLVPRQAKEVIAYVDAVTDYRTIEFAGNEDLIIPVDDTDEFVEAVLKQSRSRRQAAEQSRYREKVAEQNQCRGQAAEQSRCENGLEAANQASTQAQDDLHIVYTPLHGTGRVPVLQALRLAGFTKVDTVAAQMAADGDFPTVVSPNPEDRRALELGIAQAKESGADIVLGTDPDSDRVGIAVKTAEGYQLMTGNQVGALLVDYVLNHTDLSQVTNPAVVKTVVTSELGAEIARKKGLAVFSTLTGFKFIGEKITQFEEAREVGDFFHDYEFVLGYEESYGYLAGTHARDKDAVVSSLLICEMAAAAKGQGKTLVDRINEIYAEFGYYRDALDSFTLKGKEGLEKIASMMSELRAGDAPFAGTKQVFDYSVPVAAEMGFGMLPTSNVLKYILEDDSWIAVRPSGTEPKIKIYYSIKGSDEAEAEKKLLEIQDTIRHKLGL